PIYECIKGKSLDYVCVVVTRYFGGVKLGAGGLVRAYGGACADVLNSADKVSMRLCRLAEITIEYSQLKTVRRALQSVAKEQSVSYSDKVTLHYLILDELSSTITDIISQNTLGKGQIEFLDKVLAVYDKAGV
ncbi:MAG: YigZ family protein, partial [Clostridia bacterium]|nr:YigZ family protein [Clostridia bacterium]